MSGTPTVNQIRRQIITSNGDVKFEVTTTVVDRGDLPFPELFVVQILDPLNPKADVLARIATPRDLLQESEILYIKVDSSDLRYVAGDPFVRVANASDITALPRERTLAVQENQSFFLTTTVTLLYDTVVTANAAYRTLLDRLSTLVTTWRTYRDTFSTNPSQDYPLPQLGVSVETALAAIYTTKKAAAKAAADSRDALAAQKKTCDEAGASARQIYDMLGSDIAFLRAARATIQGLVETGSLVGGVYTVPPTIVFNNVVKTWALGTDPASYLALQQSKEALYNVYRENLATQDATCRAIGTQLAAAETAATEAQRQAEAALGALLQVCPTFDPNTVVI